MNRQKIKQAINDFYGDTTLDPSVTREVLEDMRDHIDSLLEALEERGA